MKKESRVILTEAQHQTLTAAAERFGMALATYIRWCAMSHASSINTDSKMISNE
jgi:hypothetical protein